MQAHTLFPPSPLSSASARNDNERRILAVALKNEKKPPLPYLERGRKIRKRKRENPTHEWILWESRLRRQKKENNNNNLSPCLVAGEVVKGLFVFFSYLLFIREMVCFWNTEEGGVTPGVTAVSFMAIGWGEME